MTKNFCLLSSSMYWYRPILFDPLQSFAYRRMSGIQNFVQGLSFRLLSFHKPCQKIPKLWAISQLAAAPVCPEFTSAADQTHDSLIQKDNTILYSSKCTFHYFPDAMKNQHTEYARAYPEQAQNQEQDPYN